MTTLHDRLADLADEAPPGGPAPDLWERGRRLQRRRTAGVVAVTVALVAVSLLAATSWSPGQRTPMPAGPEQGMRLPDHIYAPSSRLPGTDEAGLLGPVSAVIHTDRDVGFRKSVEGVVGISASTGEYRFLDMPGFSQWGARPSPDGRRLAYPYGDQEVDGIRVYDTVTGEVSSYEIAAGWEHSSGPVWVGDDVWFNLYLPEASDHENDAVTVAWTPGEDPARAQQRPQITRVEGERFWFQDLPEPSRGDGGRAGLIEIREPGRLRWWTDLDDPITFGVQDGPDGPLFPVGIPVSPDGARIALMGRVSDRTGLGPVVVADLPGAGELASSSVVPGVKSSWVLGWRDDDHVVATTHGEDILRSVDVDTGETTVLVTYDEDAGATFADDVWTAPMIDAPRPSYPPDPALMIGLCSGFVLLVGAGAWRRRGRA